MSEIPLNKYKYLDTPDGEDIGKKLYVANKMALPTAIGFATVDVFMYSHPKGYWPILSRYLFYGVPVLGIANIFVLTSNFATIFRQKDDEINWALGGIAAGAFYGAVRRKGMAAFAACIILAGSAILKKVAIKHDTPLFLFHPTVQLGTIRSVRHDFTLTKERPRNWTTGK